MVKNIITACIYIKILLPGSASLIIKPICYEP
jgi:hypothetical protein